MKVFRELRLLLQLVDLPSVFGHLYLGDPQSFYLM
jgi:hypothetical protein